MSLRKDQEYLEGDRKQQLYLLAQGKMDPSYGSVLAKLLIAQALGGSLVLLVCPQFGISFSRFQIDLVPHHLMSISSFLCDIYCGAFFVLLTGSLFWLVTGPGHWRKLIYCRKELTLGLAGLSALLFALVTDWGFAWGYLFWGLGASCAFYLQLAMGQKWLARYKFS